jgi:hypothetical protein
MRDNEADFSADSRVQFIDIEYARGADDLKKEYLHRTPILYIESVFYPDHYAGDKPAASRVEAWEFMVGGCAGFMHLNALYTTNNPDASGTEIDIVLDQLALLKKFMESFDFVRMERDRSFVAGNLPRGAFAAALSEPGKQYAFYIHHSAYRDPPTPPDSQGSFRHSYVVTPGVCRDKFSFNFPAGRYTAEWIEPATGKILRSETVDHQGGVRETAAPEYQIDIALRMKSAG